jgi:hypothetical protein
MAHELKQMLNEARIKVPLGTMMIFPMLAKGKPIKLVKWGGKSHDYYTFEYPNGNTMEVHSGELKKGKVVGGGKKVKNGIVTPDTPRLTPFYAKDSRGDTYLTVFTEFKDDKYWFWYAKLSSGKLETGAMGFGIPEDELSKRVKKYRRKKKGHDKIVWMKLYPRLQKLADKMKARTIASRLGIRWRMPYYDDREKSIVFKVNMPRQFRHEDEYGDQDAKTEKMLNTWYNFESKMYDVCSKYAKRQGIRFEQYG